MIVESEEVFILTTEATHPNDAVNGSTEVIINDNDGTLHCNLIAIYVH